MRQLDWLENSVKWIAALCLFAVLLLVSAQIASRHLLDFSLAAASELSIYSMIWSVFLGAAVAFRNNGHIAMDFVKQHLPPTLSTFASIVIFLCLITFLSIIIMNGYDLSLRAMRQMSPASGIPVGYASLAMPVGSVLAMVFLVENMILQFRKDCSDD